LLYKLSWCHHLPFAQSLVPVLGSLFYQQIMCLSLTWGKIWTCIFKIQSAGTWVMLENFEHFKETNCWKKNLPFLTLFIIDLICLPKNWLLEDKIICSRWKFFHFILIKTLETKNNNEALKRTTLGKLRSEASGWCVFAFNLLLFYWNIYIHVLPISFNH